MFDMLSGVAAPTTGVLIDALGIVDAGESVADAVDRLHDLERLKAAAAAAQARITADLHAHGLAAEQGRRRAAGRLAGPGAPGIQAAVAASVGGQVGLARRESPHRGRALTSLGRVLVADLPHTLRLLEAGEISERRAEVIAGELADLTPELRRQADARLAGPTAVADGFDLGRLGTAEIRDATRRLAIRFDPDGTTERRARARTRRRVVAQPRPDGMSAITATVDDLQAAAVMTSLRNAAALALRTDPTEDRTREQIITDTFVARLTGQPTATAVPVAVNLVVSAETLLGDDETPARADGPTGPVVIPAAVARQMVAASPETRSTIRRLFHHDGALVAMESSARTFTGALRDYIAIRDSARCRTPWCDAPVRHYDHVTAAADGGPTTAGNGQGLCEACNYLKQHHGWLHRTTSHPDDPLAAHQSEVVTPTRHTHPTRAPDLPIPMPPAAHQVDRIWGDLGVIPA